jgi:hypothetical protein
MAGELKIQEEIGCHNQGVREEGIAGLEDQKCLVELEIEVGLRGWKKVVLVYPDSLHRELQDDDHDY